MYPTLSAHERQELVDRYEQLPSDQAVEILASPQTVAQNGHSPQSFHFDERVGVTRPDPNRIGQVKVVEVTIGLFVRRKDDPRQTAVSAVVILPNRQWIRVAITALTKLEPQLPPSEESQP